MPTLVQYHHMKKYIHNNKVKLMGMKKRVELSEYTVNFGSSGKNVYAHKSATTYEWNNNNMSMSCTDKSFYCHTT